MSDLYETDDLKKGAGENWKADKTFAGKPVVKPMYYLRKKPAFRKLVKQNTGQLTDYSGQHKVKLEWKLNEVANRDKVFKLTIDEKVVYLDLDELLYYTRVMFA